MKKCSKAISIPSGLRLEPIVVQTKNRSFALINEYRPRSGEPSLIFLRRDVDFLTVAHEIVHDIEFRFPRIAKAARDFLMIEITNTILDSLPTEMRPSPLDDPALSESNPFPTPDDE